jgi:hypothetical protein
MMPSKLDQTYDAKPYKKLIPGCTVIYSRKHEARAGVYLGVADEKRGMVVIEVGRDPKELRLTHHFWVFRTVAIDAQNWRDANEAAEQWERQHTDAARARRLSEDPPTFCLVLT